MLFNGNYWRQLSVGNLAIEQLTVKYKIHQDLWYMQVCLSSNDGLVQNFFWKIEQLGVFMLFLYLLCIY